MPPKAHDVDMEEIQEYFEKYGQSETAYEIIGEKGGGGDARASAAWVQRELSTR